MRPTMGSLFAGIGGFDLGFTRAGFDVSWQVEIDPWCRKVLAKNFPDAERFNDIRECGAHNLSAVDVVCGGFPCQDISNAGLRAGIEGERSGLWSEYARIIGELRPQFVLVENVAALLGRGLSRVLGDLAEVGYDAEWEVVSAADVGAPHLRERVWILAYPQRRGWGQSPRVDTIQGPLAATIGAKGPSWIRSSRPEMAHAHVSGLEGRQRTGLSQRAGERVTRQGGTCAICDTASERLPHGAGYAVGEPGTVPQPERSDWWAVEPDVGRGFDGVSVWLDRCIGRGLSNEESRRCVQVLRSVWSGVLSDSLWRAARGLDRIQQAQVLFSFVRQYEEGAHEARLLVEGQEAPENFLRELRLRAQAGGSPRRSGQGEQLAGEHTDALQFLPRLLACDTETSWAFDSWEDATPRTAHSVPKRVDRLRGLGNAVVPQIPEMYARRIKSLLEVNA